MPLVALAVRSCRLYLLGVFLWMLSMHMAPSAPETLARGPAPLPPSLVGRVAQPATFTRQGARQVGSNGRRFLVKLAMRDSVSALPRQFGNDSVFSSQIQPLLHLSPPDKASPPLPSSPPHQSTNAGLGCRFDCVWALSGNRAAEDGGHSIY